MSMSLYIAHRRKNASTARRFSMAPFQSLVVCMLNYLLGSIGREWYLRHIIKSNVSLLWPWPLTSWPLRSTDHAAALGTTRLAWAYRYVRWRYRDRVFL